MQSTRLSGIHFQSVLQPDRRIDFNGFFIECVSGGLLVDPLPLDAASLAFVREHGGALAILVTNADHWRGTGEARTALSCKVFAPAGDRERFGARAAQVDAWIDGTEGLPESLRTEIELFSLRGGKSPVEFAVFVKSRKALIFGDLVRSHESGRLRLLPDDKLRDKALALESLRPLLPRPFEAVLLGDGDSIFSEGKKALFVMLDGLEGVLFNRMNLDALTFQASVSHPKAATEAAQVSRAMTCRKLGFHVRRLLPGMKWPAFHYEFTEEEVFLVRKGRMTVRTTHGRFELEPGDLIALPPGPDHAHQFENDNAEPCEFLALSHIVEGGGAVYPDGQRIMVGERGEMYRIADQRKDYWEDEPSVR